MATDKTNKGFHKGFGLLPKVEDKRDLKLGAGFKLPKLSELPAEFEHPILEIKDQLNTDFCGAYSSVGASELQEGVKLVPEYQFALIKEIQGGDVDSFGADLRSIMKSHQKFGALEEKYRPPGFSLKEKDQSFLRRIGNWPPELKIKALEHAKRAY